MRESQLLSLLILSSHRHHHHRHITHQVEWRRRASKRKAITPGNAILTGSSEQVISLFSSWQVTRRLRETFSMFNCNTTIVQCLITFVTWASVIIHYHITSIMSMNFINIYSHGMFSKLVNLNSLVIKSLETIPLSCVKKDMWSLGSHELYGSLGIPEVFWHQVTTDKRGTSSSTSFAMYIYRVACPFKLSDEGDSSDQFLLGWCIKNIWSIQLKKLDSLRLPFVGRWNPAFQFKVLIHRDNTTHFFFLD